MRLRMMGRKGPVEVDDNGNPIPKKKKPILKKEDIKHLYKGFIIPLFILVLFIILASQVLFTVNEMEQALVIRFGKISRVIVEKNPEEARLAMESSGKFSDDVKIVTGKGLMFKVPFIDRVEKYSSQLITYKTLPGEVTALDKKKIILDNNAQWKITNPALFRISMGNVNNGNRRLDDLIFSGVREKVGKVDGSKIVHDKEFVYEMLGQIEKDINSIVVSYGMEVVDVRIAKTEFPEQNYENIFNRMRTERFKMANRLRAEGDEQYKIITANSDKKAEIIKAEAYAKAEKIKGEGDAEALKIYARTYNVDPEFYDFYKSLETYKKTLGNNTKLVIDSNSEFAKYLFKY